MSHTKKIAALIGFFCISLVDPVIFAQTQPMVRIYIAPMESGTPEEQEYFMTNMKMEFIGAAYEVVDTLQDSDYNVTLSISRQEAAEFESADGKAERQTGEETSELPDNTVTLTLFDSGTNREMIALSWDYKEVSDMNMWNLYLITQAMSNAPITKIPAGSLPAAPPPAAPPPVVKPASAMQNKPLWFGIEATVGYTYPSDGPYVSGALAIECDFLPFMGISAGFGYQALFPIHINSDNMTYYHTIQHNLFAPVLLKFLLNAENFLVIPYVGAEFNFGTLGLLPKHPSQSDQIRFMPIITGGVDFRLAAGPGALDIGGGGNYDFDVNAWGIEVTIGYKFGVLTRAKNEPTK
ncbi:MAG: hypothetical protein LBP80_02110 [Treponema sp.]|nr:hypothetical protein [Treponema sp.]